MNTNFTEVDRDCGKVLLHKSKPCWIVFYEAIAGVRMGFYQAYRAVAHVPSGRMPWTVDNRRIGDVNHGFPTAELAMEAIENLC